MSLLHEIFTLSNTLSPLAEATLRLALLSIGLSLAVLAAVQTFWCRQVYHRSRAMILALGTLALAPALALAGHFAGWGWSSQIKATATAPNQAVDRSVELTPTAVTDPTDGAGKIVSMTFPVRSDPGTSSSLLLHLDSALCLAALLWLAGSAVIFLRMCLGQLWVAKMLRSTRAANADEMLHLARAGVNAHKEAASPNAVSIRVSPLDMVPFFTGLHRRSVVIPERLFAELSDRELAMVIEHECSHADQGDQWIALLQQLALAVHWWNPLLHAVSRQLSLTREALCDEHVTADRSEAFVKSYALLLVTMSERFQKPPTHACGFALAAASGYRTLRQRIMWMQNREQTDYRLPSLRTTAALACAAALTMLTSACGKPSHDSAAFNDSVNPLINDVLAGRDSRELEAFLKEMPDRPDLGGANHQIYIKTRFVEVDDENGAGETKTTDQVQALAEPDKLRILIKSRFIEVRATLATDLPPYIALSDERYRALLHLLNTQREVEVDLLTAPTLTTYSGQRGQIEVGQRLPLPKGAPEIIADQGNGNEANTIPTGMSLEIIPSIRDGKFQLVGNAVIRERHAIGQEPSSHTSAKPGGDSYYDGVMNFDTLESFFGAAIEPGSTLLINCGQSDKNKARTLLIALTPGFRDDSIEPE